MEKPEHAFEPAVAAVRGHAVHRRPERVADAMWFARPTHVACAMSAMAVVACSGGHMPGDASPVDAIGIDAAIDSGDIVHAPLDGPSDAPLDGTASCVATAPPTFERTQLDPIYRAEGVGAFDVDNDGHIDIVTDQSWYPGPLFRDMHEIRMPAMWDPAVAYADCFGVYPVDINHDGYADIIVAPHHGDAMYWYENPQGRAVHWARYMITPVGVAGLENPIVEQLFASGPPVLVMTDSLRGTLGWFTPPDDPTQLWVMHPISSAGFAGAGDAIHGIGVGDVNGDGRNDVLTAFGWFEQPANLADRWAVHSFVAAPTSRTCHRMWTYRIDGDDLADIVCSRPHDYGIYWYQQHPGVDGGDPIFVEHLIDDTISQMHALRLGDLDGDGVPEIISGKRWWAEGSAGNPGVNDPAVLVYYTIHRDGGAVSFGRHIVDSDSGIGGAFAVADVDGDCRVDIVTANKKGLYWFRQR